MGKGPVLGLYNHSNSVLSHPDCVLFGHSDIEESRMVPSSVVTTNSALSKNRIISNIKCANCCKREIEFCVIDGTIYPVKILMIIIYQTKIAHGIVNAAQGFALKMNNPN